MTENYGAQLILIDLPPFETEVLRFICQRSNSLYNQAIYFVRRNHQINSSRVVAEYSLQRIVRRAQRPMELLNVVRSSSTADS